MRSSTSSNYLTTGIAYAWHAHRDTWYSAPPCQLNWWLPIYELHSDNAMAFHPRYWSEPVKNSSAGYNYYTWNKLHRGENVAKLVKEDPRPLPRAIEPMQLDPQIRLDLPGRRRYPIFGGADALERAKHFRRNSLQHRFS